MTHQLSYYLVNAWHIMKEGMKNYHYDAIETTAVTHAQEKAPIYLFITPRRGHVLDRRGVCWMEAHRSAVVRAGVV